MEWRKHSAQIIARVISENGTQDMTELRKELYLAYPYGERKYHPYKIWCDEIRVQLKLKIKRVKVPDEQMQLI